MRTAPEFLSLLQCPGCGGELHVGNSGDIAADGHLMQGELECSSCNAVIPVVRGVPRFAQQAADKKSERTVSGFGYQWRRVHQDIKEDARLMSSELFLDFVAPVERDFIKGKTVLDAGCGMGRFTAAAQRLDAKLVVGADLSDAVDDAFSLTRGGSNVLIIQADLLKLPLRPVFDYGFSLGVLHHTPDPGKTFDAVSSLVRADGAFSAWVYSLENNEWIVRYLNPLRKRITSHMPRPVLLALAHAITVPLFATTHGVYGPVGRSPGLANLKKHLFYFEYMHFLSDFCFSEQAYIVFDHLSPVLAEYIPRRDFQSWFERNGFENVTISDRTNNSWRGTGFKKQTT